MTKKEFKKEIKKLENEKLCWFSETELNSLNIPFKTLSSIVEDGSLVYVPLDDIYVGAKTFSELYK